MQGVEFLSFQALWFVVAGFILGFATSTLWEWLYYRGKRQAQRESSSQVIFPSTGVDSHLASGDEPVEGRPTPAWTLPYRSPGVYLESEQAPAANPTAPLALSPASAPGAVGSTAEDTPVVTLRGDVKAPRINPATLAALQVAVAQPPVAQTTLPSSAVEQPPAAQAVTNTKVYDSPAVVASTRLAPATEPPAAHPTAANGVLPAPASTHTLNPTPMPAAPVSAAVAAERQPPGIQPPSVTPVMPGGSADHPDDLALIKGVGEAYKRRLYGAGVYTWRQVAESDTESLRRITRAKPNANIGAWRQQARELAEKYQRWTTTFQGPLDDFTRIDGIGAITADILYKAGLCTYDQLASALPDELTRIVPAPTVGDEINFDEWISTAARLATAKRRNQGLLA